MSRPAETKTSTQNIDFAGIQNFTDIVTSEPLMSVVFVGGGFYNPQAVDFTHFYLSTMLAHRCHDIKAKIATTGSELNEGIQQEKSTTLLSYMNQKWNLKRNRFSYCH